MNVNINNIPDYIISDVLKRDKDVFMQAKLLAYFTLLCVASSIVFLFFFYLVGLTLSFYSVLVVGILFSTTLILLRYAENTFIYTRVVIILCYAIILIMALDSGGSQSPIMPIFIIVPIISFFIGTKSDGILFTIASFITVLILFLLPYFNIVINNNILLQYQSTYNFTSNLFAFIFIIVMIFLYNKEMTSSRKRLIKANKKLRGTESMMKEMTEQAVNFSVYLGEAEEELKIALKHEKESKEFLKSTQAQLIQSEKMASVGQLTAGIAHEINNPVNFIQTGIEGLEQNLDDVKQYYNTMAEGLSKITEEAKRNIIHDPIGIITEEIQNIEKQKQELYYDEANEEIEELIASIKNGASRTAELVLGLRTFSRLDEGALKEISIETNIDSTLLLLKNKFKKRIEIIKEYTTTPMVECYPGKLNQVFMNLLVNAIQAIPNEGRITIKTKYFDSTKKVRISITDTGSGIPMELQGKIYDPFFTTKSVGEGTGLGLAITKGIIDDHYAELTFDTVLNKGTTFKIDIPVVQPTKKDKNE